MRGVRYYLAGPMTGIPNLNKPLFDMAASILRGLGHDIVNPTELEQFRSWDVTMRHALRAMLECDAVILLPGWERSRGALLEFEVAQKVSMTICEYTKWSQLENALPDVTNGVTI